MATKATLVRELIVKAKAEGVSEAVVINTVIAELGMARGLAHAYVMNNWNKEPKPAKEPKAAKEPAKRGRKPKAKVEAPATVETAPAEAVAEPA